MTAEPPRPVLSASVFAYGGYPVHGGRGHPLGDDPREGRKSTNGTAGRVWCLGGVLSLGLIHRAGWCYVWFFPLCVDGGAWLGRWL